MKFTICYNCRRLACTREGCDSPKCRLNCENQLAAKNVDFIFCAICRQKMLEQFERQFPKRGRIIRYDRQLKGEDDD